MKYVIILFTPERWKCIKEHLAKHNIHPTGIASDWSAYPYIVYVKSINALTNWTTALCSTIKDESIYIEHSTDKFINEVLKLKNMKKEFTKADLKPGMVIEYNNGTRRLVTSCKKGIYFTGDKYKTSDSVNMFTEDLRYPYGQQSIDRIYIVKWECTLNEIFDINNLELIWERNEPKEYTMQEIADKLGIPVEQLRIKK